MLPCIKLKAKADFLAYAQAMYDGGARVIEVTMTTPGALEAIEAIAAESPAACGWRRARCWTPPPRAK